MKIGIVGAGKWGRTLAAAFGRSGVEIAAHSRLSDGALPDRFGPRVGWEDLISDPKISAVVAATPPDLTTKIFTACQQERKPCLLTKPFLPPAGTTENQVTTTTYVDYVHLFSPLWQLVSKFIRDAIVCEPSTLRNMSATSTGQSPVRSFPQSLDYAPHALALLLDTGWRLDYTTELKSSLLSRQPNGGETLWVEMNMDGPRATMCAGYGQRATTFHAELNHPNTQPKVTELLYAESNGQAFVMVNGEKILRDDHHNPLTNLVQKFIWDVKTGEVDATHVLMSIEIARIIEIARRNALSKLPEIKP
jgi:predicted dehydrogenase